ncbi:Caspase domain-containing protein [Galbibacter orientalis DSM 19592]|uniref:Caspase domain-containing protein n=1 Tax=Galbibacter orientalis DSM 19592 TaxID=926559 RepID=I3C8K0_9FLAO|nr:caspase family protein [Galbibacter orientalis]EIJ39943.1 Caspase domain-containing protein [Galbibacter orientalis DSM 19592]
MSNHIFAIGIDNYKNCTKLNNAVRDIENIVDILTDKYDFNKSNVTKLLNEEATLENITNELENYLTSQDESQNLIILFSGHGEFDDLLQMGYLIPQEALPYSKSTYFPYSTLFSYIKALKSHHILLVSDSCFSGSVFTPYRKIETSKEKLDKIPSKWAITSGRIEPVSDGEPGKNSPFAEALITVLNKNTGSLSISEISNRIVSEVAEKVDQIPRGEPLQSYGHKGGEFIFTRKIDNKASNPKKSKDFSEREELLKLIESNYELEEKIEEAENENKTGTIRRLTKEKESLTNILNKELLKELEIQRVNVSQNIKNEDKLPKNYFEKYEEIMEVRKKKNAVVKKQKYQEAAILRDEEKKLEKELQSILNQDQVLEKLDLSTESLYSDYFLSQLIMNIQSGVKFDRRDLIENIFGRLLFFDLSFKSGKISPFIFKDTRAKLVEALKTELNKTGSNN